MPMSSGGRRRFSGPVQDDAAAEAEEDEGRGGGGGARAPEGCERWKTMERGTKRKDRSGLFIREDS